MPRPGRPSSPRKRRNETSACANDSAVRSLAPPQRQVVTQPAVIARKCCASSAEAHPISSSLQTGTVRSSSIRPASSTPTAVTDCLCTSTPITIIRLASNSRWGDRRTQRPQSRQSHAPIRSRSTVSVAAGDTTLESDHSLDDIRKSSQPPPIESAPPIDATPTENDNESHRRLTIVGRNPRRARSVILKEFNEGRIKRDKLVVFDFERLKRSASSSLRSNVLHPARVAAGTTPNRLARRRRQSFIPSSVRNPAAARRAAFEVNFPRVDAAVNTTHEPITAARASFARIAMGSL